MLQRNIIVGHNQFLRAGIHLWNVGDLLQPFQFRIDLFTQKGAVAHRLQIGIDCESAEQESQAIRPADLPRQIQQSRRRNQHTAHELKGQPIETEDASCSLFLAVVRIPFFLERSADFHLSLLAFGKRTQHRNAPYVFHHLTDQMLLGLLVNGGILGGAKPHPTQDQHPKCQPHKAQSRNHRAEKEHHHGHQYSHSHTAGHLLNRQHGVPLQISNRGGEHGLNGAQILF